MKYLIVFLLSCLSIEILSQNLSIPQTIQYINTKLNENQHTVNTGYELRKYLNQVEVTNDGYFIIYEYEQTTAQYGKCMVRINKFLIKNSSIGDAGKRITNPYVKYNDCYSVNGVLDFFASSVKTGYGSCDDKNMLLTDSGYGSSIIRYSNHEIIGESLCNAFKHLFDMLSSDPNYNPKTDPNDPFAPENYKKDATLSRNNIESSKPSAKPCEIKKVNRLDGAVISYIAPELVGIGSNCELGLGIQSNGEEYFLIAYVRYFNQAKKTIGNLRIKLSNDQSLELELYRSELANLQNEKLASNIFIIRDQDINQLISSNLKVVVFKEDTGIDQVIIPNQNYDVIRRQLKCFKK